MWRLRAAAFEEIDATPMGGFDPAAVDDILDLPSRNLRSVIIMPIGYRATEGDGLVNHKKVRRSRENFVRKIR
jgi:nitroreductase/dihydropteridine reductase